jgi:D-glycero-D-manno-heptose 1,7-bisphosphate phosphatase
MVLKKVVLLDRDGVVNRNRADCIHNFDQFQFLPGSFEAIVRLCRAGLIPALITNQSCVGRGWVPESRVRSIHQTMQTLLNHRGGGFTNVYFCPHNPKAQCRCRKPEGAMLRSALRDYRASPMDAVYVGDNLTDFEASKGVGIPFILVLTGRGKDARDKIRPNDPALLAVKDDLAGAVGFLLRS